MLASVSEAAFALLSTTVLLTLLLQSLHVLQSQDSQRLTLKAHCPRTLQAYLQTPTTSTCPLPRLDHAAPGLGKDAAPEAICYLFFAASLPEKPEFNPYLQPRWQRVLRCN